MGAAHDDVWDCDKPAAGLQLPPWRHWPKGCKNTMHSGIISAVLVMEQYHIQG